MEEQEKIHELKKKASKILNTVYGDYDKDRQTSIHILKRQMKIIELLVAFEFEQSRSEFIRKAIDFYLPHVLQTIEIHDNFYKKIINKKIRKVLEL